MSNLFPAQRLQAVLFSQSTRQKLLAFTSLVGLMVFFSATSPNFLQTDNMVGILQATAVNGVLAIACTFVIITSGIDLSVGTLMTFCAVMAGVFMTYWGLPVYAGIAAAIFGPLSDGGVNVDMIVQNVSADGTTDMTFTVGRADLPRARAVLDAHIATIGFAEILADADVAKISVVGTGMRSHAGVASTMFKALADRGINIQVISTSEIKVSVLIAADYTELAVRALHTAYGLDAA